MDLDGIYAAIEDDRAYSQLASHIASACRTRSALFMEVREGGAITSVQSNYWDDAFVKAYRQDFMQSDPWVELALSVGRFGRAAALDSLMPPDAFARTAICNDLLRAFGDDTGRCLGIVLAPGNEGPMMAIHRAANDAAFTVHDERRLDDVYDHVRRVVMLRRTLETERCGRTMLQDIVDQTGTAILRVNRDLRVTTLSAPARHLLAKRDGLALNGQRLAASTSVEAELRAAVAAIIDRTPQARTALLCRRPSGRRPYRLLLLPAGFEGGAGALLRIDDPDITPHPHWRCALQEAYGLSAMEADLAERLYAEYSLHEIAAQRGVTRETLRTQLKSLFHKTGVNRQSELVKLLATFPGGSSPTH